jgi:hypothetical protein
MKERYKPEEIIRKSTTKTENSFPELGQRDRFGNKLFVSRELAYLNGVGEKVKAGILVSPEGQKFIAENQGILKDIERALILLETNGESVFFEEIDLGNGRKFQAVKRGRQSNFYILTINGKKYAIKTHTSPIAGIPEAHQPYINEMLQTQNLGEYLERECPDLRVKMSSFLFASGQVSCTKFEDDDKNYDALNMTMLKQLQFNAAFYIDAQKRHYRNKLWENVDLDFPPVGTPKLAVTALNNFRTKSDGTIIWIDPFIYHRPDSDTK